MTREYTGGEVAIIGMACRFPQSPDWRVFWRNLIEGRELVSFFSRDELLATGLPAELVDRPNYVPAKAALEDADCFDYSFFGYSQREARKMDPQLRVLHEVCHDALLDACIKPSDAPINAGVFLGSTLDLQRMQQFGGASGDIAEMFDVGNYNDPAAFASQIAYQMKLIGPALHVQTACSTSLSAVHLATKALLAGECSMAFAGGACVTEPMVGGYLHQDGMILSPDGHCRTFSDQGQGTVNGNGAGVVLLKLLEDALADGDPIHAVIVESAMNNDGDRKVSFEAPSVQGQAEAISRVYQLAGIPFSSLGLLEAHGTATVLGDPIEIQALNKVATELLKPAELAQFRCAIGSVKSNMGHLDAAAGIAGLIKAALSVRFGRIPPSLHFLRPNPHLSLDKTPFRVPTQAEDWPAGQAIRRAGVSSFGIGGTNVHVLLEQAPEPVQAQQPVQSGAQLLPLSAGSPVALARLVDSWSTQLALQSGQHVDLATLSRQLRELRQEYPSRAVFVTTSAQDWREQLAGWSLLDGCLPQRDQQVWLFPGQGAQSPQMGLQLARRFPEFGERYGQLLAQAEALLQLPAGHLLECVRQPEQLSTLHLQPILYALQVALAQWLRELVGRPAAVCGFSLGEFAAAAAAGVFSAETGMKLVVARARLMENMPRGALFAASRKKGFDSEFPSYLWRVCELSPGTWTLATAQADAAQAEAWLANEGFACKRVAVSHAFHTPLIEPAANEFGRYLQGQDLQPAHCDIYSTARGRKLAADEMKQPRYWVDQMLGAVQFGAALQQLEAAHPGSLHLQIGAGADLLQHARKWLGLSQDRLLPTLGSGGASEEVASHLQCLGRIWAHGGRLDWSALQPAASRVEPVPRSHLPGHAFERRFCGPLRQAGRPPARVDSVFFGHQLYGMEWERVAPPAERSTPADAVPTHWIFSREIGQREHELASALGWADARFIACPVWHGDFSGIDAALQDWLSQQGLKPTPAMDVLVTSLLDPLDARQAQFWSFWLPLALARWSATQQQAPRLRLVFPASQLASWQDEAPPAPEKSQLLGPLLIVPEEYPHISALCVDFADSDAASMAHALQIWLDRGWRGGEFCCHRRGAYWRRRISSAIQQQAIERSLPDLHRNSWVLVTGAAGGMGTVIARHLADVYRCNLLLQVRKPLPARREWPSHVASQGPDAAFLQHVLSLERAGSQVVLLEADFADEAGLAKVFAPFFRLVERGIAIDYVFHTAGRGEGAMIQLRSEAESLATLAPKVNGTRFLCAHRQQLGNPALLLFSSLGNLLPKEKVGQVAYVSANACLEAYAELVRQQGGQALAIAWDDWAESGMATRSARQLDQALNQAADGASSGRLWRRDLDNQRDWWLDEHRLDATTCVMPAMGMVVLVQQSVQTLRPDAGRFALLSIAIEQPLLSVDQAEPEVVVAFDDDYVHFGLYSGRGEFRRDTWQKHASGRIGRADDVPVVPDLKQPARHHLYRSDNGHGVCPRSALQFGPRWHNVLAVDRLTPDSIVSCLQLPAAYRGEAAASKLHVALLDTATLIGSPLEEDTQFAPVSIGRFCSFAPT
jgi:acyl transferase domain-containing protein